MDSVLPPFIKTIRYIKVKDESEKGRYFVSYVSSSTISYFYRNKHKQIIVHTADLFKTVSPEYYKWFELIEENGHDMEPLRYQVEYNPVSGTEYNKANERVIAEQKKEIDSKSNVKSNMNDLREN